MSRAIVTAGLKCPPLIGPSVYIRTSSPIPINNGVSPPYCVAANIVIVSKNVPSASAKYFCTFIGFELKFKKVAG